MSLTVGVELLDGVDVSVGVGVAVVEALGVSDGVGVPVSVAPTSMRPVSVRESEPAGPLTVKLTL